MRRTLLLSVLLIVPLVASAQKPPPLGAPDTPPSGRGGASPSTGGKPPPLGAPDPRGSGRSNASQPGGKPPPLGGGDEPGGVPGRGEEAESSGTGFAVADGRLLTNNHVVRNCRRMVARNSRGQRVVARVDKTDSQRDLALLTVQPGFATPLQFRENPPMRRGESIVTYGFPLSGLLSSGPTLTTGDVSALSGLRDNPRNLQISAPVQPGNSGGPLLDLQARVVGIVVSKLNAARIAEMTGGDIPQNVNFAVKGTEALAFLRANGVEPQIGPAEGQDKRAYEVGEIANTATVYMQCFQ